MKLPSFPHSHTCSSFPHPLSSFSDDKQGRECSVFLSTHRVIFQQERAVSFLHLHLVSRAEQQGGWLSSTKLVIHLNPRPLTVSPLSLIIRSLTPSALLSFFPPSHPLPLPSPPLPTPFSQLPPSSDFLAYQAALIQTTSSPTPPPPPGYLRLSLRPDGLSLLLTHLTHALTSRIWLHPSSTSSSSSTSPSPLTPARRSFSTSSAGVSGLIRDADASTRSADRTLDAAFTDLTSLMQQAGAVVSLAEKLRRTLAASPASSDEEAAFTSLLTSIGLPNPITRHSTPPSSFHTSLAHQLHDFISTHPRFTAHHMLTLTEVFCLYNRARGTDLISPADCLKACEMMGGEGVGGGGDGLRVVELRSGVRVVCKEGMVERGVEELRRVVGEGRGLTALEAGTLLGLSVLLVEERCSIAEGRGWIVRDESVEGCRWWPNLFEQWPVTHIQALV